MPVHHVYSQRPEDSVISPGIGVNERVVTSPHILNLRRDLRGVEGGETGIRVYM